MTDREIALQDHYAQLTGANAEDVTVADLEHGLEFYLNYGDDRGYPVSGDHLVRTYN
ncbi:Hypothetical protein VOLT_26 [Glutamicibacter phage Voltaire]|uniref:Hypothetical protein n=1 Tax=Glutamicibacter phage Voltaire TaxID=2891955 RepID=UPI002067EC8C|nr:Hypothetical protein QEJ64_gp26 [Glutamicibacter phage Voltaire]CAH1191553.1 Hypothetical protein VOLT_26 [Glutamicibacter phage Voltaire]